MPVNTVTTLIGYADPIWDELIAIGDGALTPEAVHQLRVCCKRLRACWLLRWQADGAQRCDQEERRIRAIAKPYGSRRDHDVALLHCARLAAAADAAQAEAIAAFTATIGDVAQAVDTAADPALAKALAKARSAWQAGLEDCDDRWLRRSYLRLYVKGRRWSQRALNATHKADLQHRWRRWVKHCYFAGKASGLVDDDQRQELKALGSALGRRQDLHVLAELVDKTLPERQATVLRALIEADDAQAAATSQELGKRCFKAKRLELSATLGL